MSESNQIICTDLENCVKESSTIQRILVPYDDSKYSERAFALALDLAQKYGASLITLTIVYENPSTDLDIRHQTLFDKEKIKKINKKFKLLKKNIKKIWHHIKKRYYSKKGNIESYFILYYYK